MDHQVVPGKNLYGAGRRKNLLLINDILDAGIHRVETVHQVGDVRCWEIPQACDILGFWPCDGPPNPKTWAGMDLTRLRFGNGSVEALHDMALVKDF
jgi:hypothetical protein